MGFSTDFLYGLAQHLETQGVGAWRPDDSPYLPAETAIVIRGVPQSPDRVISLSDYTVTDSPTLNDSTVGVQMLLRGGRNPSDVEDLDDLLFDVLHGASRLRLGTVFVNEVARQSSTPVGQDGNSRWQISASYHFLVVRPSRHRID